MSMARKDSVEDIKAEQKRRDEAREARKAEEPEEEPIRKLTPPQTAPEARIKPARSEGLSILVTSETKEALRLLATYYGQSVGEIVSGQIERMIEQLGPQIEEQRKIEAKRKNRRTIEEDLASVTIHQ